MSDMNRAVAGGNRGVKRRSSIGFSRYTLAIFFVSTLIMRTVKNDYGAVERDF